MAGRSKQRTNGCGRTLKERQDSAASPPSREREKNENVWKMLFPTEVCACRAAEMIRHIERPGIRSRMMGRLRLVLQSEGWPSMKMRVLTFPRESRAAEIKGALNSATIKSSVPLERTKIVTIAHTGHARSRAHLCHDTLDTGQ